jgi:MFS family permease
MIGQNTRERQDMPDDLGAAAPRTRSIESRASWQAAAVTLAILSVGYGATMLIVVGLRAMERDLGVDRSVLALAASLTWIGTGLGGVVMGWLADRIGIRASVTFGAVMVSAGLALVSTGHLWAIYFGHGVLIGLLGMGAIYPPLVIYVSRWFDRRRGTAVALISSGQYVAGAAWPTGFARIIADHGWRLAYLGFAGLILVWIIPLALLFLRPPPAPLTGPGVAASGGRAGHPVLGLPPNLVQVMICAAGFCCCVPMAIPQAHLVAFCGDLGIRAETGATMFSVMLACAFFSRQLWGLFADRNGGLLGVLAGNLCQVVAMAAYMLTRSETGLFAISALYGLGFSGIIPSYVVGILDLFPSSEASWRVPLVLFSSMSGMAFGSWFAGFLYDRFGFYTPAFAFGLLFNLFNLVLIGTLVLRQHQGGGYRALRAAAAG